tara:strand:- start:1136 stop:2233 length:1098 start_codon:yes stop_codon:yes gene_type:complete
MAIKAKGFFGRSKSGFKLGSNNKLRSRFIRSKVNSNKNVKFAKKFFKSDKRLRKRYIRRKTNLLKRKAAEKALEGGQAVKTRFKKSITKKGFNPIKFITVIFVGWIINVLPKIISTLKKWMEKLKPVFDTLKSWVKGIVKFFTMIGDSIGKFVGAITGSTSTVDAEKKKIEGANKKLKGTFKKSEDGFNKLEKKAKSEEKNLKKDMDNLDSEVNEEKKNQGMTVSSNGKIDPITVLDNNKNLVPAGTYGIIRSELENNPTKYDTKEKIKSALNDFGIDSSKVKFSSSGFTGTTNQSITPKSITPNPKNGNVNLKVDSSTKTKVVTVDVPVETKPPQLQGGSVTPIEQNNSDSVNSSELLLNSIDK